MTETLMTSAVANPDAPRHPNRMVCRNRRRTADWALTAVVIALLVLGSGRGEAEEPAAAVAAADETATATTPQPATARLAWETGAARHEALRSGAC